MVKYSKARFENTEEARQFVKQNEIEFENKLTSVINELSKNQSSRIITLTGPTCSGKTTTAKKIISTFEAYSKRVNIISIDDFYYDNDKLVEISRKKGIEDVDYDSADTIDLEALETFVEEIFDNGKSEVHCPVYDFPKRRRTGYRLLECTDDDIFVFEGIQALYPEVVRLFEGHDFSSIFICAMSTLDVGGIIFEPNEIRLLRRIVRDNHFRATSAGSTLDMWENVRHNEDINIFPFANTCKYHIDSVFPHEISLLKPYLDACLPSVPSDSEHFTTAQNILKKIAPIEALPKEFISENSLYHEFI